MTLRDAGRIAFGELHRNRLRSTLTALGIVIGVATVITMVSTGRGAAAQVQTQLRTLGENVILVSPGSRSRDGVSLGEGSAPLTVEDARAIGEEVANVAAVSPETYVYVLVTAGERNSKVKVYGESADYLGIRKWPVGDGAAFDDQDVRNRGFVALIGTSAAKELFGDQSPVGGMVRVGGIPYRIVGLLTPKGDSVKGHDQDDVLIVPYTTMLGRLIDRNASLNRVVVEAAGGSALHDVQKDITSLLRARHRIGEGAEADFSVKTQQDIEEVSTGAARTMTLLLGALACVSLLVGGIGIMNIMLVGVTERTREIGVRMAVGAHPADILRQFLVEALLLALAGGCGGTAIGIAAARALSAFADWPTLISADSILLACVFSAGVGLVFGYLPARKASRLDPVESLRYE